MSEIKCSSCHKPIASGDGIDDMGLHVRHRNRDRCISLIGADHAALVARVREIARKLEHADSCDYWLTTTWLSDEHKKAAERDCTCQLADLLAALGPEETR